MQVIKEAAEKKLMEVVDQLNGNDQWCGLLLHISKLDPSLYNTSHINAALNMIKDKCAIYNGSIFVLSNHDIILILKGMLLKDRDNLLKEVQYAFIDDPFSRSTDFSQWFHDEIYRDMVLICHEYFDHYKKLLHAQQAPQANNNNIEMNMSAFANASAQRKTREKLKILVAEDDAFSRKLTKRALEKEYEVILAANGTEAIEKYALHAPNVMFLDIGMPGISGMDVLEKLVHVDDHAFIVMLTSDSTSTVVKQAITLGAKGYIVKPFNNEKLAFYLKNYKERSNER